MKFSLNLTDPIQSLNITHKKWSLDEVKNNIFKFNIYYRTG